MKILKIHIKKEYFHYFYILINKYERIYKRTYMRI